VKLIELFDSKPDIYGDKNNATGRLLQKQLRNLLGTWRSNKRKGTFDPVRRKLYLDKGTQSPIPTTVSPSQPKPTAKRPPTPPSPTLTENTMSVYAGM
jgi:hypothetical protein